MDCRLYSSQRNDSFGKKPYGKLLAEINIRSRIFSPWIFSFINSKQRCLKCKVRYIKKKAVSSLHNNPLKGHETEMNEKKQCLSEVLNGLMFCMLIKHVGVHYSVCQCLGVQGMLYNIEHGPFASLLRGHKNLCLSTYYSISGPFFMVRFSLAPQTIIVKNYNYSENKFCFKVEIITV